MAVRVVVALVLLAAVLPFVVYAVPQVIGADHSYIVLSGSMRPGIHPGDVVVARHVNPASVSVGDVIVFKRPGQRYPTTHRVIDVSGTGADFRIQTKGDANHDPDQDLVTADHVLGRVVLVIPYIGHVVDFVHTWYGFALMVVAPMVLLLVTEAASLFRGRNADGRSTDGRAVDAAASADATSAKERTDTDESAESVEGTDVESVDETPTGTFTVSAVELRFAALGTATTALYALLVLYSLVTNALPKTTLWTISATVFVASLGITLLLYALTAGKLGDDGDDPANAAPGNPTGGDDDSGDDDSGDDPANDRTGNDSTTGDSNPGTVDRDDIATDEFPARFDRPSAAESLLFGDVDATAPPADAPFEIPAPAARGGDDDAR